MHFPPLTNTMKKAIISGTMVMVLLLLLVWRTAEIDSPSPTALQISSRISKAALPTTISENSEAWRHRSAAGAISERVVESKRVSESKEQVIETIKKASAMYSPAAVPILAPYLTNSDPEIREAALDAFLRLDEPGSIPILRATAAKMNDRAESKRLLDAADFLSLPPYKPIKKKISSAPLSLSIPR